MNSYEMTNLIQALLLHLSEKNSLIQFIQELEACYKQNIRDLHTKVLGMKGTATETDPHSKLQIEVTKIREKIKALEIDEFYDQIKEIESSLTTFIQNSQENKNYSFELLNQVKNFKKIIQPAIKGNSFPSVLEALQFGSELSTLVRSTREFLSIIHIGLMPKISNQDFENQELERSLIIINSSNNAEEISMRISAFVIAYNKICLILKIDISKYPLRFLKLESGSIYLDFIGNKEGLKLLLEVLLTLLPFLYSIWDSHRNKKETKSMVEKLLEQNNSKLLNALKERGIELNEEGSEQQGNLIEASVNLVTFIQNTPSITINNQEFPVAPPTYQQSLPPLPVLDSGNFEQRLLPSTSPVEEVSSETEPPTPEPGLTPPEQIEDL